MLAVLQRFPAVRYLLAARLVSSLGDWFTYMMLVVLSYMKTGSPGYAMMVLAAQAIATLVFSFFAGPLADRIHPSRLMVAADLMRALLVAALFVLPVSPDVYAAAAFLTAGAAAFFNPAEDKWVMLAVPESAYASAAALRQLVREGAKIVGPSLAVAVLALFGSHELRGFLVDALSFAASAALLFGGAPRMPPARAASPRRWTSLPWRDWRGLGPTLSQPDVQTVTAVLVAVMLALGGIDVVLLAFVRQVLRLPMLDLGYLVTALSLGIIVGTALTQLITRGFAPWQWLGLGLVGLGLFLGLASVDQQLAASLACMAIAGIFNGVINVNLAAYTQRLVQADVAGRFFSLLGTLLGLGTVAGMAANTWVLLVAGPRLALMAVGGFICLAGVFGAARLAPWPSRQRTTAGTAD